MCHVSRKSPIAVPASVEATPVIGSIRGNKSIVSRISPFRKMAKSARINLNKYWGILSQKQRSGGSSKRSSLASVMEFDHSTEMEENHINEMLEAMANAEEQNSINSQIESDSECDFEQPRRMFVRQRACLSSAYSCNSFSSHGSSSYSSQSQDSLYF